MELKAQSLEEEVKALFDIPDLKKHPYHLHAMCVHDGNATSGHYFTFIYDRFQKKWRKYNDITVSEVSSEDVYRDSEGGNSWKTAYWVVYIKESISRDLEKVDCNNYVAPEDVDEKLQLIR